MNKIRKIELALAAGVFVISSTMAVYYIVKERSEFAKYEETKADFDKDLLKDKTPANA